MKQVPRVKVYFSTIKENIHALGQTIFSSLFNTLYISRYTKYNNSPNSCTAF